MKGPGVRRQAAVAVVATLVATGLGGCAQETAGTTLTVHAAASLAPSFERLGAEFEAQHDDVDVVLNVAGSSDLVAQVGQGAAGDVMALADEAQMARAVSDDLVADEPVDFATNSLTIVVPAGNPAGVRTLADLTDPELAVVLCAPQVPCGAAAVRAEEAAAVDVRPVSEEQSVTDVLSKVVLGEADAGLVYVTDVERAGDAVEGIDLAESAQAVNTCPVAVLADSAEPELAAEFVALVRSTTGRRVLTAAGFGPP